jgi:thiaminase
MALAPCLHGYYFVAKQLHESPESKREDNPYWTWVLNYVADDYVAAYRTGVGSLAPVDQVDDRARGWDVVADYQQRYLRSTHSCCLRIGLRSWSRSLYMPQR